MGKLSSLSIPRRLAENKAFAVSDGGGLTLTRASGTGAVVWVLRYAIAGKRRELTLGRYPDLGLEAARKRATEARAEIAKGTDVARERRLAKHRIREAWTVERLAEDYLAKRSRSAQRTKGLAPATVAGRRQQLRDYVHKHIGHINAGDVTTADIVDIVEKAGRKSHHVARLVMIALREIFAHGIAMHRVEKSPCAEVKASAILGEPPDHRERLKLSDAELRAMLEALPSIGKHNELAIKILLATATRVGELTRARWEHIDFQRRTWTIPAAHAKNRKEFVIPLAEPVAGWFHELREIAFGSDYVLPIRIRRSGKHDDRPMEPTTLNAAVNRLCKSLGDRCRRFVPHDLRSTARSHFAAMGVPVVIAERCLNHALGGLVEVYDQHDYLDERREVLSLWARYIVACETGHAWNVTDIRTARRKRT